MTALNCLLPKSDVFKNSDPFLSRQICSDVSFIELVEDGILQQKENQHFSTLNINSYGFRGSEFSIQKDPEVLRVIVVGNNAFGTSATSDNTTITGFLQENFNSESNLNVEVINAAILYSDSFRDLYLIKNKIINLQPDLIIVYSGWIDAAQQRLEQKILESSSNELTDPLKFKNYPEYRTLFVLTRILDDIDSKPVTVVETIPKDKSKNQHVALYWKDNTQQVCALGKENNFKTIIAIQPLTNSGNKTLHPFESYYVENDYTLDAYFRIVEQLKELKDCNETIDLTKIFNDVTEPIFTSKGHTSDLGNEIIAKKLFETSLPLLEN